MKSPTCSTEVDDDTQRGAVSNKVPIQFQQATVLLISYSSDQAIIFRLGHGPIDRDVDIAFAANGADRGGIVKTFAARLLRYS